MKNDALKILLPLALLISTPVQAEEIRSKKTKPDCESGSTELEKAAKFLFEMRSPSFGRARGGQHVRCPVCARAVGRS